MPTALCGSEREMSIRWPSTPPTAADGHLVMPLVMPLGLTNTTCCFPVKTQYVFVYLDLTPDFPWNNMSNTSILFYTAIICNQISGHMWGHTGNS